MKSNDGKTEWNALVELCRILNKTPLDNLEAALKPVLDIDETLRFLALDVALINSDGYWTRASDYTIFREKKGMFHIIPHDMNEAFRAGGGHGPPGGGRPGRGGPPRPPGPGGDSNFDLDPLVGLDDPRFPLRSRLLNVPALREKYLGYIHQMADTSLDWNHLGSVVAQYRSLIESEVKQDQKLLGTYSAFEAATSPEPAAGNESGHGSSLRTFADRRRKFLLEYKP